MLFVTTTVAARIERAEAGTARDFGLRARAAGADVLIEPIGGTVAVFGGPGEPFNKIAGLGFAAPLDEADLVRLEAQYDARGGEIRVEQATLADTAVAALLTRRGYELIGYENVLGVQLDAATVAAFTEHVARSAAEGIEVSRAAADEMPAWIDTITDGVMHADTFDGPARTESFEADTIRRVFASIGEAKDCAFYMGRRDGEIAGAGSLRMTGGLAQLSGAATLPPHRRRGVQSALLRARLVDAAALGCDLAVVTTEPASKSQENVQRAGFSLLYARAVLRRPARPV